MGQTNLQKLNSIFFFLAGICLFANIIVIANNKKYPTKFSVIKRLLPSIIMTVFSTCNYIKGTVKNKCIEGELE